MGFKHLREIPTGSPLAKKYRWNIKFTRFSTTIHIRLFYVANDTRVGDSYYEAIIGTRMHYIEP